MYLAAGTLHGAFRLWYGGFVACKDCATSEGKDRVNAWHYANSSDGIHWEKPHLGIFDLAAVPELDGCRDPRPRKESASPRVEGIRGNVQDASSTRAEGSYAQASPRRLPFSSASEFPAPRRSPLTA